MLGIALGVAALIIVLSVMNGFRRRCASHAQRCLPRGNLCPARSAFAGCQRTMREARSNPDVVGASPFVTAQALLARGEDMKGALVRGMILRTRVT
ncbi:hypothetical protein J4711_13510 [Staphylococcus epidermidis]|nr:hypothetical protein [Staphylococcus epidermidis]